MDNGERPGPRLGGTSPFLADACKCKCSNLTTQVVFPALLPLTYIPTLLARTKQLFISLFQPYLQTLVDSLHGSLEATTAVLQDLREQIDLEKWSKIFERCLRDCEGAEPARKAMPLQRQAQLAAASSVDSESACLERAVMGVQDANHRSWTNRGW